MQIKRNTLLEFASSSNNISNCNGVLYSFDLTRSCETSTLVGVDDHFLDEKLLDDSGQIARVLTFGCVLGMSDRVYFSAKDVLKGKVDVGQLTSRYVFLRGHMGQIVETLAEALNYMAKFGWRAVGFSRGVCLLERVEQ